MSTFDALEQRLEPYVLKAAEIRTKLVKKAAIGSSKYGGRPDLPADVAWPIWSARDESYPFTFVGQVALEDVVRFDQHKLLPKSGLLLFFALVVPFTDRAKTKAPFELARVIHVPPRAKLTRTAPPASLSAELLLPESKMSFRGVVTWPRGEGIVIGVRPSVLARTKTKGPSRLLSRCSAIRDPSSFRSAAIPTPASSCPLMSPPGFRGRFSVATGTCFFMRLRVAFASVSGRPSRSGAGKVRGRGVWQNAKRAVSSSEDRASRCKPDCEKRHA